MELLLVTQHRLSIDIHPDVLGRQVIFHGVFIFDSDFAGDDNVGAKWAFGGNPHSRQLGRCVSVEQVCVDDGCVTIGVGVGVGVGVVGIRNDTFVVVIAAAVVVGFTEEVALAGRRCVVFATAVVTARRDGLGIGVIGVRIRV